MIPVLLLELLLRVAGPFLPGDYQTTVELEPSVDFGRVNRPNSAGWHKDPEYTTWVRINSKGLRGPEVDYAKPPNAFRILVLGDSFTLAPQVTEEETFVARLSERLNQAAGARRFETINAGTSGWNTVNEYAWLSREGYRYEPQLVLLMFFVGNDPRDNADQVNAARGNARILGLASAQGLMAEARRHLRDASLAYTVFETGVVAKLLAKPELDAQQLAVRRRMWSVTEDLLDKMRDYCVAERMRFLVVIIPTGAQVSTPRPEELPLPRILDSQGIEHVDLTARFRTEDLAGGEPLYFAVNRHWTAKGHDLAAEVVAAELQGRRLLATGPSR